MANWINRKVGEIVLAGFGVFGAAAIGFAYNLGQNATRLESLDRNISEVSAKIDRLEGSMNSRFDLVESKIELDQTDLRSILIATGVITEGDAFYAAVIQDDIWVFPSDPTRAKFIKSGMSPEQATNYLSGFRMMPASAVE